MIPAPSLDTMLQGCKSLLIRNYFTHEDIDYEYTYLNPDDDKVALVMTLNRAHLKTPVEEEIAMDAFGDVMNDCGNYKRVATFDCTLKDGSRLLLEQVYKRQ